MQLDQPNIEPNACVHCFAIYSINYVPQLLLTFFCSLIYNNTINRNIVLEIRLIESHFVFVCVFTM